jgi:hypothetical protein
MIGNEGDSKSGQIIDSNGSSAALPTSAGKDGYESAQQRLAWVKSDERRRWMVVASICVAVTVALSAYVIIVENARLHQSFFSTARFAHAGRALPYTVTVIVLGAVCFGVIYAYYNYQRNTFNARRLVDSRQALQSSEAELARSGELDLVALWRVTQQRLDYYHEIITSQARRSFMNAQFAMIAGLIILAITVPLAFVAKSTAVSVTTGILGGIGASLAGYIGRTFIRSQENAAEHLRSYFTQPLYFSRCLAAERLLKMLPPDDRSAEVDLIIEGIINSLPGSDQQLQPKAKSRFTQYRTKNKGPGRDDLPEQ